jgi:hypothetical protein
MAEESKQDRTRSRWIVWAGVLALLMGVMFYLYALYPEADLGPQQPIYFSHRVHAGVKQINCRFCHPFVDRSENAGIPPMEKCFFCHQYIIPSHPQIVKEREHYDQKIPVRWLRIFYVPDYVKFRHEPHINWGKLDCTECHGAVATFDRLKPVNFEMNFCITCHKKKNAQIDCWLACHH